MNPVNFDTDALRTLVVGVELGGFSHAAQRLSRSPSAVSMQLRKLERQAGQRLVKRNGRGLLLTEAGEVLLAYARRILNANDEMASALGSVAVGGTVRAGMPQDVADILLSDLLARFAESRPMTHVEVKAGRNYALADEVANGRLDMAITFAEPGKHRYDTIATLPLVWLGPSEVPLRQSDGGVLPLVVFDGPCLFRETAIAELGRAGTAWRLAMTTPGLTGVWCGVSAGLGATVRTAMGIPPKVSVISPGRAIPPLPTVDVALIKSNGCSAASQLFMDMLVELVEQRTACSTLGRQYKQKASRSRIRQPRTRQLVGSAVSPESKGFPSEKPRRLPARDR
jgi:DNA-binding transcriptional LysR family regulator